MATQAHTNVGDLAIPNLPIKDAVAQASSKDRDYHTFQHGMLVGMTLRFVLEEIQQATVGRKVGVPAVFRPQFYAITRGYSLFFTPLSANVRSLFSVCLRLTPMD
jgi:hypothetical protein